MFGTHYTTFVVRLIAIGKKSKFILCLSDPRIKAISSCM